MRAPSLPVDGASPGHDNDQGEPVLKARYAYAAAVALADTGQTESAIELLRHHCRRHPEDTPARELLVLLDPA